MAKKRFLIPVLIAAGVFAATALSGCVSLSSVGGTSDAHGFFTFNSAATSGAETIGSYGIVLGLFDIGYEGYVKAVRDAEAAGKSISSETKYYLGVYVKVTAYAK